MVGVALLTCGALSYLSADGGDRWMYPYWNTLSARVLPKAKTRSWFAHRGLPVRELREFEQANASAKNQLVLVNDRRFTRLEDWTRSKGRSVYAEYLLAHPGWVIDGVTAQFDHDVSFSASWRSTARTSATITSDRTAL